MIFWLQEPIDEGLEYLILFGLCVELDCLFDAFFVLSFVVEGFQADFLPS